MTQIKLKRVYDDVNQGDGLRVLVDRLWPRGIKKEELPYDLWAKDITPSNELRKWFHENPEKNWDFFAELYQKELTESESVQKFTTMIKLYDVVTLLYASKDKVHNHAVILADYLVKTLS
jgi:uncharacterized protein YeaO (DUF488 family)